MKYMLNRRGLALGVVILLIVTAFGASNVPGVSEKTNKEQIQEMIEAQKDILLDITEFPNNIYLDRLFLLISSRLNVCCNFSNGYF